MMHVAHNVKYVVVSDGYMTGYFELPTATHDL